MKKVKLSLQIYILKENELDINLLHLAVAFPQVFLCTRALSSKL